MQAELDHLVVAADRLQRGVAHVERCLGVRCQPGGRHPGMGTHNALVGLGASAYLEVIAIAPDAGAAPVPRWFGLDEPMIRQRLRERPRLLTWVARTADLGATLAACTYDAGTVRNMRRGDLRWKIAFPEDGHLIEEGLVPTLIQWQPGTDHPARGLPDDSARLVALHAGHPQPARVRTALSSLALEHGPRLDAAPEASLGAWIRTPRGECWLD